MHKDIGKHTTMIVSEGGKYLAIENVENSEMLIGKPLKILLSNDGLVPEFIEKEVN